MKPLTLAIVLSLAACGAPFTTAADPASSSSSDAGGDVPVALDELAPDASPAPAADAPLEARPLVDAGVDVLEHQVDAQGETDALEDAPLRVDTGRPDAGAADAAVDAPGASCEPSACPACPVPGAPCCTAAGCGCSSFGICR
jgi:hypothetical protein